MNNIKKAMRVFERELSLIESDKLVSEILNVFEEVTPDYFWDCAASKSGRFHPRISNGKYGLLRHTKLVCYIANEINRSIAIMTTEQKDNVIAACLLHDLIKNGTKPEHADIAAVVNGHITGKHGVVLYHILKNYNLPEEVGMAVATHMGTWTSDKGAKDLLDTNFCQSKDFLISTIVHMADYIASRKIDSEYGYLNDISFEALLEDNNE